MGDRNYKISADAPVEEYMRYFGIPRNQAIELRAQRIRMMDRSKQLLPINYGSNEENPETVDSERGRANGGRIGYALGGNEMLRDSRQGLGSMMAAGDETEPPMEIIDPGFDTGPEELLQELDREGTLRTAAMEDPMLGLIIEAYDMLKDQGQLPNEYLGPQGLEKFITIEGERIIQSMQQRDEGAGIASLRA